MSENESHHHGKNEIIIIKRHGGHDGGHHGGAWKIAYADFMTAMMAFFLVMWLVNAANEDTKAAVASYFNPIKLTDSKPATRSNKKPAETKDGEAKEEKAQVEGDSRSVGQGAASGEDKSSSAGKEVLYTDANYFENPYAVLSEIVLDVSQKANVSDKSVGGKSSAGPASGADGGPAYRDPFDPDFWTQQEQVKDITPTKGGQPEIKTKSKLPANQEVAILTDPKKADPKDAPKVDAPVGIKPDEIKPLSGDVAEQPGPAADGKMKPGDKTEQANADSKQDPANNKPDVKPADVKPAETAEQKPADQKPADQKPAETAAATDAVAKPADAANPTGKADAKALADQLKKELANAAGGNLGKLAEGLTVEPSEGGLLVSIMDQSDSPMFNVGSSVPKREMVLAMEKIAKVLEARKGKIAIRGHTDARPYKTGGDNWDLSMNRAHSAYFMLVRGGFDENRITQVTGFADRRLKVPADPMADANRRIEILIEANSQG